MKNKILPSLLLVLGIFASTGISSVPTTVRSGPIRARTFNFVGKNSETAPTFVDDRATVHRMIQNAITKNLEARGIQRVSAHGDIAVPYLVIIGNNVSVKAINDYFGYSKDFTELLEKAHAAYTQSKNPNEFEAGTLLIDILDGKSFRLLMRSYASREILHDLSDEKRAARIQKVVDEILENFQVVQ